MLSEEEIKLNQTTTRSYFRTVCKLKYMLQQGENIV